MQSDILFDGVCRRLRGAVLAVGVMAFLSGCGQGKEPEPSVKPEAAAMVPAAVPETTTTAAAVETTQVTSGEIMVTPGETAEKPAAAVSSPFHRPEIVTPSGDFVLQLGSFRREANVRALQEKLRGLGYAPEVEVASLAGQTYHRVLLKGLSDRAEAMRLGEDIRSQLGVAYLIRQQ